MSKRIIIGEGSYGCVHKPSIHCDKLPSPGFNYDEHVSKIMKTKYAEKELNEFLIIHRIDPSEEYHLGTPILCKPEITNAVKDDIDRCKHLVDFPADPDNYSLLLFKYGGPDIKGLCSKYLDKYLSTKKEEKINKIFLEFHHLLKGLKAFRNNDIVHYDIKPQNILFDTKTGKMTFIDFGLTQKKEDIIKSSENNKNALAVYHWSYPLDNGFLNEEIYNKYKVRTTALRNMWKKKLIEMIVEQVKVKNISGFPITKPETFKIFFTYLNVEDKLLPKDTQTGYIESFFDGFNELLKEPKKTVINKIIDSIDVYGLGFSLQYFVNCLKRNNHIDLTCYTRVTSFLSKMYDFNPMTRVTDLDVLLNEYENILLEIGVLSALKKHFSNNNLEDGSPIIRKSETVSSPHLSAELEKDANLDATEFSITVSCPEDKEWHPIKKRCVKKCKEGFVRDSEFKCVKRSSDLKEQQNGGTKVPLRYIPYKLTKKDKLKQKTALQKSRKLYKKGKYFTRPKVASFKSKPSKHILNAQKIYGIKNISPTAELATKTGCSIGALRQIVKKGEGAYYSSGSRPNQTAQSWGYARLASAITSGKSAAVDYKILENGCKHKGKAFKLATKAKKKYGFGQGKTRKINI